MSSVKMASNITRNSKVPFGRPGNKGRTLSQQPVEFLKWISTKLWDTDKHNWAVAAREELKKREADGVELRTEKELEQAADAFLRRHHIDPNDL